MIKDTVTGKTARRYQVKYCQSSKATEQAFSNGQYQGQRKLTPAGQEVRGSTTFLESPDGVRSNELSYDRAQELQQEAQSGNWQDTNWNGYAMRDLTVGIAKNAGRAGLQGTLIGAGFELGRQICTGEEVKTEELVRAGLKTGSDFAVKTVVASGLKVATEKGVLKILSKGTPAAVFTDIAFVAVENVKVLGEVASGDITVVEGLEKMERVSVSSVLGLLSMGTGTMIGSTIGAVLGPAGAVIGGFVGSALSYMAGSAVGEACVKVRQKIRRAVVEHVIVPAWEKIKEKGENLREKVRGIFSQFSFW